VEWSCGVANLCGPKRRRLCDIKFSRKGAHLMLLCLATSMSMFNVYFAVCLPNEFFCVCLSEVSEDEEHFMETCRGQNRFGNYFMVSVLTYSHLAHGKLYVIILPV